MSTLKTNTIQTVAGKTILGSTGSILQVVYGESPEEFDVSVLRTYQIYYSVNVTAISNNSKYFLNGFFTGWSGVSYVPGTVGVPAATRYGRSNIGYSVTISGSTTRILGVDGLAGDSWAQTSSATDSTGNVVMAQALHSRPVVYTSTSPAGTLLTFNLLAATYDVAPLRLTTVGFGQKSGFTIMEISA
jgi:hypothetical protein